MADPFVAEIRIMPYNFAPSRWAFCSGQLLPIAQNTALFSLLGTYYGGDGKSTFALPNLNGSVPIGAGDGPGLTSRFLGESGGQNAISLLSSEMPAHTHGVQAHAEPGELRMPKGSALAVSTEANVYGASGNVQMNAETVAVTGQGLSHNNMQPYLVLNFCIALQGVFPARG